MDGAGRAVRDDVVCVFTIGPVSLRGRQTHSERLQTHSEWRQTHSDEHQTHPTNI